MNLTKVRSDLDVGKCAKVAATIMCIRLLDCLLQSANLPAKVRTCLRLVGTGNAPHPCHVHVEVWFKNFVNFLFLTVKVLRRIGRARSAYWTAAPEAAWRCTVGCHSSISKAGTLPCLQIPAGDCIHIACVCISLLWWQGQETCIHLLDFMYMWHRCITESVLRPPACS